VLGRAGRTLAGPATGGSAAGDVTGTVLAVLAVAVLTAGSLLLVAFATVRGRDAFRDDERSASELLRTLGLGAAGVALVVGGARALAGGGRIGPVLLNVVALIALVLIADRVVPPRTTVTRPAVLTPAVLVLVVHLFASGGLFGGDLFASLYTGSLAAGTTVVLAVTIEHQRRAALLVPLLVALHWWPTCLSPLPFGAAGC
jgi:hypothetical protein